MASSISAGATSRRLRRRATVTGRERALYTQFGKRCANSCALCRDLALGKSEKKLQSKQDSLSLFLSLLFCVCVCLSVSVTDASSDATRRIRNVLIYTLFLSSKKKRNTFSSFFIYFFFFGKEETSTVFLCVSVSKVFPPLFFFVYFLNLFEWARKSSWRDVKIFFWKFFCCVSNPLPPLEKYNSGRRQKLFLFRVREYWTITGVTQRERKLCFFFLFPSGWRLSKLLKEIKSKDG